MVPQLSLLYTTFPPEAEITKILKTLLEANLIACANILGPITSLYSWQGALEESQEIAVLFKTTPSKTQAVLDTLGELHPYDTPAILEIPVGQCPPAFAQWVHQSVKA